MKYLSRIFSGTPARRRAGVSLVELMVAVTVLTVGVIASMGAFKYLNRAMTQARLKTIASNLAQEKMEVLKNKSYFQLLVTTASTPSTGYPVNFLYDTAAYPPQTITLWGLPALTRVVNVDYVTASGSVVTVLPATSDDPGMKKITVTVMWTDGGAPRKVQLDSYYENPSAEVLSAGFRGTVTKAPGGAAIGNVLVQVMGSPQWYAYSDAAGAYNFQVAPGTYTLVSSTDVYYSTASPTLSVAAGAYTPYNFTLTKIAMGSISGMAYIRDHLVISQVVGSTVNSSGFCQEYVELYNPTTYYIQMAAGMNISLVELKMQNYGEAVPRTIVLQYPVPGTGIASNGYFLIANTAIVTAGGVTKTADAVYNPAVYIPPELIRTDNGCGDNANDADGIGIAWAGTGEWIDRLGWRTNPGNGPHVPPLYEGTSLDQTAGLDSHEQFVRRTNSATVVPGVGRAYDTNNNDADFIIDATLYHPPHNSMDIEAPTTGTPAAGARATANDGLSSSALVSATGSFFLTNVATGAVLNAISTWTVTIASYTVFNSSAGLYITPNQNNDVGTIILSTAFPGGIAMGCVYGSGPDQYKRLGNPSIKVCSGGITVNTDSQGFYMLFLGTGTVAITANCGSANGGYQSADVAMDLAQGTVTEAPDFHLAQGGYINGYVTSGTGAVPNIVVQATNGGAVYENTSDSTGHFYIYATTSAAAYTVTPVLDPLQSYTSLPATPLISNLTVPGGAVFAGTITVVGALGTIAGNVTFNSGAITTGVLVVASTAAVPDPMAAVTAAVSASQAIFYSASSQADGTYSLDVRSSSFTTYNMTAFYPVVNAVSGAVSYSTRNCAGVPVSAGVFTPRNFSW